MVVRFVMTRRLAWVLLSDFLILTGLIAVLYCVWFYLDGALYQRTQRREFRKAEGSAIVNAEPRLSKETAAPESLRIPASTRFSALESLFVRDPRVVGQLRIPSVNLEVMIREGLDEQTLRRAAGHLESSAMPGQRGNVVVLGHRDTFFHALRDLKRGSSVEIRTLAGNFLYEIDVIQVVEPEHLEIDPASDRAAITLITCFPFDYVGPSPRRFVAQGRLITE